MTGRGVTVQVTNTYECGRTSVQMHTVQAPAALSSSWWESVVWPLTGDGHACGAGEDALYEVQIVSGEVPEFIGCSYEWGG